MPDAPERRSNAALWLGLLLIVLGIFSNFFYFVKVQAVPQGIVPWINLMVPAIGLVPLFVGLKRAFGHPQVYRGKIWGSIVTAFSVLLFAASVLVFFIARALPRSTGAPQVGQRLPDFTLPDSSGRPVSLAQLLSGEDSPQPRAVLLIFYRGYW
jgi:hypothetical protein